jgi:hypothetical protein
MFKRLTLLMLASLVLVGTAPQAMAKPHTFTLHNRTGVDIYKLQLSHHSQADWDDSDDILEGSVIQNGAELEIDLDKSAASWDLRVESKSGGSLEWNDVNLNGSTDVILERNGVARFK